MSKQKGVWLARTPARLISSPSAQGSSLNPTPPRVRIVNCILLKAWATTCDAQQQV